MFFQCYQFGENPSFSLANKESSPINPEVKVSDKGRKFFFHHSQHYKTIHLSYDIWPNSPNFNSEQTFLPLSNIPEKGYK